VKRKIAQRRQKDPRVIRGRGAPENPPNRKDRVLNRVRDGRDGNLYDSRFHTRMKGQGIYATHIQDLFEKTCRSAGLSRKRIELSSAAFRCRGRQEVLFE